MRTISRVQTIEDVLGKMNAPPYRLKQVLEGIYKQHITTYAGITALPKEIREALSNELGEDVLSLKNVYEIEGGQAHKILFETKDHHRIEAVRMTFLPTSERDRDHYSLCISSQSGCALACTFCATGAIGFKKNLTPDEIADQILCFKQKGHIVNSASFMGMGEPFANPNLFDALKIIIDKNLLGFSQRKISISTVGIVPGIKRLQKEFPEINLSFSLHSPFPAQRLELMPITKAYSIQIVMFAIKDYIAETNRKVFISYVLLDGVNDSEDHAKEVVKIIKNQREKLYLYHVNLIRFNPGATFIPFKKPKRDKVEAFQKILSNAGIEHTLRQSFGVNISAACGQLYGKYEKRNV